MQYALIKNQEVVNVIVAEQDFIDTIKHDYDFTIPVDSFHEQKIWVSTGWKYIEGKFSPPIIELPTTTPPVWQWYIDIGPFFDRFKELKILVLTSTDPTVQALIKDIQIRKWIDLELPEVAQALQYIGTVIPQLNSDRILEILTTPVSESENLALRKLYFS